jgi:tetratricopeptide (TPR) repeat protein
MIKLLTILLFLLSLPLSAMDRQQADALLSTAHEAYSQGEHEQALLLYDSVNTYFTSGELLFNIGNCHFKLNDVPKAILYYERALKLSPGADDVQSNLELARQQIMDKVEPIPPSPIAQALERSMSGSSIDQWAWRAIWIWVITVILFVAGMLMKKKDVKRILIGLSIAGAAVTMIAVLLAAVRASHFHDDSEAIILTPRSDVRSEPREGSTTLFVLHKGTKVSILQEENDWYEIRLENGSIGWIPQGTLERI